MNRHSNCVLSALVALLAFARLATATPTATPAPSPDSFEPDNAPAAAKPITCGSNQTHTIAPAGDVDWVSLSLSELTDVVILAEASGGSTMMSLQDDSGTLLELGYSRISRACGLDALPAGTYLIEMQGYFSSATLSYDVSVTCLPCTIPNPAPTATMTPTATPTPLMIDSFEPDNAPAAAKPIACNSTQTHTIVPAGDVDWVSLSLSELTDVVIQMTSTTSTSLSLHDSSSTLLESGYSRIGRSCGLDALPAGTYLIELEGYWSWQTLSYDVSITCLPCTIPNPAPTATMTPTATPTPLMIDSFEPDNAPAAAKPIACNSTQTHTIVPAGDVDWVSLSLSELTDVVIQMTSTTSTSLWLHDSSGTLLESGYSRIARACELDALPAGTYLIEMQGYFSSATLSYDVSITCLPCNGSPAPTQTPPTSTPTQGAILTPTASPTDAPTATATATPTETLMPCVGDCEDGGTVTVTDILTMVNIALGTVGLTACPAGDANGDNQITVDEILMAVHNALNGCPSAAGQQRAGRLTRIRYGDPRRAT